MAELKGAATTIPNEGILITTQDELFRADAALDKFDSPAAKEVHEYAAALRVGFERVSKQSFLRLVDFLAVQEMLIKDRAGLRKLPFMTAMGGRVVSAGDATPATNRFSKNL